jgi:hypothetical protein
MTEMVERVALALGKRGIQDGGPARAVVDWTPYARAALAAMREPTQRMKSAAVIDADNHWDFGAHEARACWQAMIDAALTEPVSADSARQSTLAATDPEPQSP